MTEWDKKNDSGSLELERGGNIVRKFLDLEPPWFEERKCRRKDKRNGHRGIVRCFELCVHTDTNFSHWLHEYWITLVNQRFCIISGAHICRAGQRQLRMDKDKLISIIIYSEKIPFRMHNGWEQYHTKRGGTSRTSMFSAWTIKEVAKRVCSLGCEKIWGRSMLSRKPRIYCSLY